MIEALRRHWPEYAIEAAGLGVFMISACLFSALLEHPGSPVRQELEDPTLRRILVGLAMGATAAAIIYSPWGKQSGAHLNPSVTLAFLRLEKVKPWDAFFYIGAQFVGGVGGILMATLLLGPRIRDPAINYIVTVPGHDGPAIAFLAEGLISFVLMTVVLASASRPQYAPWTGALAAALIALYIAIEAPLSGMSMNPARTLASALPASIFDSIWIYFVAPTLGMLLAAEVHRTFDPCSGAPCAKLHHDNPKRCIHCECGE